MININKVWLYDSVEYFKTFGEDPPEDFYIYGGYYMSRNTSFGDVLNACDFNAAFDVAYPDTWGKEHNYPKRVIWIYDEQAKVFGRPMFWAEIISRLEAKVKELLNSTKEDDKNGY